MKQLTGITLSEGIVAGKIFRYQKNKLPVSPDLIPHDRIDSTIELLHTALEKSRNDLDQIKDILRNYINHDALAIIDAQSLILSDPELITTVENTIRNERFNAAYAFSTVLGIYEHQLSRGGSDYERNRGLDLRDVRRRVIGHIITGANEQSVYFFKHPKIIVTRMMYPSDFILFNPKMVNGLVTEIGGRDSHISVLARELGIPYISNIQTENIPESTETILLDGFGGKVYYDITPEECDRLLREKDTEIGKPVSPDLVHAEIQKSTRVQILANIGFIHEINLVNSETISGIGLFRTEFLCLEKNAFPEEEEQFQTYRNVLRRMNPNPVIFRTFDFGTDKFIDLLNIQIIKQTGASHQDFGGIRFCLEHPGLFRKQLRALLRAGQHGNMKIMLPMIKTRSEITEALDHIRSVEKELSGRGFSQTPKIPFGIMIETREAAEHVEEFFDLVDFISLGTNDLSRYILNIDRGTDVSDIHFYPELLNTMIEVIRKAQDSAKWVEVCGEMAADPLIIPLLFSLGVDAFSVNLFSYNKVSDAVLRCSDLDFSGLPSLIAEAPDEHTVKRILENEAKEIFHG